MGCLSKAYSKTRSGWNDQLYVDEAKRIFADDTDPPSKFQHEACWNVLKAMPKFSLNQPEPTSGVQGPINSKFSTPRTTSTTPDPSPAVSNNSSKRSRPIGRKQAKRLAFDSDRAELNAAKLARYEAQTQAALMSAEKNKQLIEDMAEIKAMMRMVFNQTAGKPDFTTEK